VTSLPANRSDARSNARYRNWVAWALLAATISGGLAAPARAAERQHCVTAEIVLWGDGRHDDTKALNAWLRGEPAIWGESGAPVGTAIAGHSFRLSSAIYVPGGTGRRLEDFRMLWPQRGETMSGGAIVAGGDPDKAPVVSGVTIRGGDPGEGKPFESPGPAVVKPNPQASCAIS
jgi:hypothetical protein